MTVSALVRVAVLSGVFAAALGCGGDDPSDDVGQGGDAGESRASAGGNSGSGGDSLDGVPTSHAPLFAFLTARDYLAWPAESTPHASAGPHGGKVRTFIRPNLDASLGAGDAQHPAGSAAVKEFYGTSEQVTGWAVSVKTQASSDGGQGWYWYEIFSTEEGASPAADGQAVPLCVGCHEPGRDFVLSPYPLQ